MPKYLLLIATIMVGGLSSTAQSAIISATSNQDGGAVYLPPQKVVRVAQFSGLPTGTEFTHIRFSGHAIKAYGFAPYDKPSLWLTEPNVPLGEFFFASTDKIETNIEVANTPLTVDTSTLVEPVSSTVFVPLTSIQSAAIQSILSSNAGKLDAWMLSTNNEDFYFPPFQESFVGGFPPVFVTETFQATLEFLVVPEPASIATYGVLIGIFGFVRRRRRLKR
jgi:hypothetical protein